MTEKMVEWISEKNNTKAAVVVKANCEHITKKTMWSDGWETVIDVNEIEESLEITVFANGNKIETGTFVNKMISREDADNGIIAEIGRVKLTDKNIVNKIEIAIADAKAEAAEPYKEIIEQKSREEKKRLAGLAEYEKHNKAGNDMMTLNGKSY